MFTELHREEKREEGDRVSRSIKGEVKRRKTERTPQIQQFKQDEETEEYPADKGTG